MHDTPPLPVISIVENEAVLREEMAFQLRQFGFRVEAFDSAEKFYRYLASRPRTIAVLDIGLDGEDGLSICRYLRDHDRQMGIVFAPGAACARTDWPGWRSAPTPISSNRWTWMNWSWC